VIFKVSPNVRQSFVRKRVVKGHGFKFTIDEVGATPRV
jgi:hypothetical protein